MTTTCAGTTIAVPLRVRFMPVAIVVFRQRYYFSGYTHSGCGVTNGTTKVHNGI